MTTFPDFIVIGAMKSGTTTLYHDLLMSPDIFLSDKELRCLHSENAEALYRKRFAGARSNQIIGEFTTTYACLPDTATLLERAKRVLPTKTKIIYMVREPISRTLSHHRHMAAWQGDDKMGMDINQEILARPELTNFSCYGMQIRPWIEAFGRENVKIIFFEKYIKNRAATISELCEFVGAATPKAEIDPAKIHNKSEGKPVINGFWKAARMNPVYRYLVRPFTHQGLRDKVRGLLFPKAVPIEIRPTAETIKLLTQAFEPDLEELSQWVDEDLPWDLREAGLKALAK